MNVVAQPSFAPGSVQSLGTSGPMIFVHGLASSARAFEMARPLWRQGRRHIYLDMPWSRPPFGFEEQREWPLSTDDVALLADAVGAATSGPYTLVAHSFGALISLHALAERRMPLPEAMILVSPFYRAAAEEFTWDVLAYYVNDFHLVLAEGVSATAQRKPHPERLAAMAEKLRDHIGPSGWMHFFRAYLATPALTLEAIGCPVLILGGAKDISAFPRDAEALAARLPHAKCRIFQEHGHFLFQENPPAFVGEIEQFLARHEAREGDRP